jgi:Protein of unknown function (DUF2628)
MKTYTVHEPPNAPAGRLERAERLVFVKDGFSWMATLFTPVWLIVYRLWWPLVGYVALMVLLGALGNLVGTGWTGLVSLALNLLIGFEASVLRRWGLDRRGWRSVGSVSGRTAEECERRFFELWLPAQSGGAAAPSGGTAGGAGTRALVPV